MNKNATRLMVLNLESHSEILLKFFQDNSDFFEEFENVCPNLEYVQKTFLSCPEGVNPNKKIVLGCFNRENLSGFVELIKDRHRPGEWLLGLLVLGKPYRKTLQGGRMIKEIFEYIKRSGATAVVGGVVEENLAAREFWNSIGAIATDIVYDQELNGKKVSTRVMYKEI